MLNGRKAGELLTKMQYIMIYVFIMSVVPTVSTEKHIIDELHIDGSSIVRPNYEGQLNVSVRMFITSLDSVSENTMDYSTTMFLHTKWKDERLFHNQTKSIILSSSSILDLIWKPDLYFENSKQGTHHYVTTINRSMKITPDGVIFYSSRLSVTLSCNMHFHRFPMDEQACPMVLLSYAYNGHELKLSWYKNQSFEVFDQNTLPQFTLAGYELDEHLLYYAEDIPPWSSLEVTFILQRQLGYYLLVFYVPCVLLVTVSFISFWLSYQATAARVSLNLTSALTVVAQGIGARFFLPRVSYTTALDVYIFASFCFVLGGLVEFAFANFLSRKCVVCKCRGNNIAIANNPKTEEPDLHNRDGNASSAGNCSSITNRTPWKYSHKQQPMCRLQQETSKKQGSYHSSHCDKKMCEPNYKAEAVDRASRYLFPIAYLVLNLIYWVVYSV